MLHEAIFPATCNPTKVALQVAKTIARVTPHFRNLQCNKMLRCKLQEKKNHPLLFVTLRDKLLRVTCSAQLAMFIIRHRCVASCWSNMALRKTVLFFFTKSFRIFLHQRRVCRNQMGTASRLYFNLENKALGV